MIRFLKNSAKHREKRLYEYKFQLELVLADAFERYLDEKQECGLWWKRAVADLTRDADKALSGLRASLEAEYIQTVTEMELQHELSLRQTSTPILNNGNRR